MEENLNDLGPMEVPEQIFTIILSDNTQLTNLKMVGNTFISQTPIPASTFERRLDSVTFTDGMMSNTHGPMELVSITNQGNVTHFELRDLTNEEILSRKFQGDIDFLAMMSDVDMNM